MQWILKQNEVLFKTITNYLATIKYRLVKIYSAIRLIRKWNILFYFVGLPLIFSISIQYAFAQKVKTQDKMVRFTPPKIVKEKLPMDTFLPRNEKGQWQFNKLGYCVGLIVVNEETKYGIAFNKSKKLVSKLNLKKASVAQVSKWQKVYGVIPEPPPPPPPTLLMETEPLSTVNKEMPVPDFNDIMGFKDGLEKEPVFEGNWAAFLSKNLKYPDTCITDNISGQVLMDFVVETNGTITNVKVSQTSPQKNKFLVAEATRVLRRSSGKWKPGILKNKIVRTYHEQPIYFVLTDE